MEIITGVVSKPLIKVAAICGSIRKDSIHGGLIRSAIQICQEQSVPGMEIEYLDIKSLPFLNTDLEVDCTYPAAVTAFRKKIDDADAILFSSPEYNFSVTAPLKNAIDWGSRPPNVWADKAAAVMSAGGDFGGGRAQYDLRKIGVFVDLHFINKPQLCIQAYTPPTKFDGEGNLIDPVTKDRLRLLLLALQSFSLRMKGVSI